jgi:outer membrane protein TolC
MALLFATMAFSRSAQAQVTGPGMAQHVQPYRQYEGPPITLADLLRDAAQRNPDLEALGRQVDVLRQRPAQARGLTPPLWEAQIWQWPLNTLNPANTNMYMFLVTQDLPGRGKRELRAAVADKDVALAQLDVAIRSRQIIHEIKQAYASLFIARKAIDLHLASVDLLRQIADVSQAKYRTGRISQQDVLKSVVELSKLHNDVIMFDEQANLASANINVLLNRAPETPIGPLVEPSEHILLPPTADLQQLALDRQPEVQKARLDIDRAEAELASATREYQPDFAVEAGYMLTPRMTDAWMGRIGVTWPRAPWSRDKIDARVAEQRAAVEAAKSRARAMENMVRLAVQEAYVRAKSAQDRAALLRTTILPQSEQTLAVSRVAYQTDRVDFQALIDNERTLLASQLEYFRALSDFEQAIADLERAIGTDLAAGTITTVPPDEGGLR